MTPLNPQAPRGGGSFSSGLMLGLSLSLVVLVLGALGGTFMVRRAYTRARAGWNLVAVVVAAVDVHAGDTLTMEMISQRSIPEQFVTASIVTPSEASLAVGQPLRLSLRAGDPLVWAAVKVPEEEVIKVSALKHPLARGATLKSEDLEVREMPVQCITPDMVRDQTHESMLERKVQVPFAAGELLLRSHF